MMRLIGYSGFECPNCGRVRVEEWVQEDGTELHICEKCHWCVETEDYFDWNEYYEKEEQNEFPTVFS